MHKCVILSNDITDLLFQKKVKYRAKILHKITKVVHDKKLEMGNLSYSTIFVDFYYEQNCNVLANNRGFKLPFFVC